jgi:hypothetical protein
MGATVRGEAILGLRPTSAATKAATEDAPHRPLSAGTGMVASGDQPPPSTPLSANILARPLAGRVVDAPATSLTMCGRWNAAEQTRPAICSGRQLRRAKLRTKPKASAARVNSRSSR